MSSSDITNSTNFKPSMETCTQVSELCPISATVYGYAPNLGGNVFFAVMFGLVLIIQTAYAAYFRTYTFYIAMLGSAALELIGYIGRSLMHYNAWNGSAFKVQIVCLILAPSFTAAGIYLVMKHFVVALGRQHSRLKAELFSWVFILADICSLILQAAGGGIEAGSDSGGSNVIRIGNSIILAGIGVQVGVMAICGIFALDFFYSYSKSTRGSADADRPASMEMRLQSGAQAGDVGNVLERGKSAEDAPIITYGEGNLTFLDIKWMFVAEVVAYTTVLIRCIYRLPEMSGGWGGPLMQKENEFLVLDGMMILIALIAFTVCHPGMYLPSMSNGRKQQ